MVTALETAETAGVVVVDAATDIAEAVDVGKVVVVDVAACVNNVIEVVFTAIVDVAVLFTSVTSDDNCCCSILFANFLDSEFTALEEVVADVEAEAVVETVAVATTDTGAFV